MDGTGTQVPCGDLSTLLGRATARGAPVSGGGWLPAGHAHHDSVLPPHDPAVLALFLCSAEGVVALVPSPLRYVCCGALGPGSCLVSPGSHLCTAEE